MTLFEAYLIIILLAGVFCLFDWRFGFLLTIAVGFFQDPVRKLFPETPIYLTVIVVIFAGMTFLGAYTRGLRLSLRPIVRWNHAFARPLYAFIALVAVQSVVTLLKTGNPFIFVLGWIGYLTPLPAVLLGYYYSRSERDIHRAIVLYLVLSVAMSFGIYLSHFGIDWSILDPVGTEADRLYIFTAHGEWPMESGFWRAPEIAGWHAGLSICLLILLASLSKKQTSYYWFMSGLIAYFSVAMLLTARRKYLVEIGIFISVYGFLLTRFKKGGLKFVCALALGAGLLFFVFSDLATEELRSGIIPYYDRSTTVREEGSQRLYQQGFDSIRWAYNNNGFLGAGAGTLSQGAQHFGGMVAGGGSEGGLGKIVAELGIPGLLLFLWLVFGVMKYVWAVVNFTARLPGASAKFANGIAALLPAVGMLYVVAQQAFGDAFILILLGFFFGFLLAFPKMYAKQPVREGELGQPRISPTLRKITASARP